MELCYWAERGHRSREAGHRLETRHRTGRGDGHGRHHQRPHSDFPRVESGQRLLQRVGPGGLNGDVKWGWGLVGGEGTAGKRVGGTGFSVCELWSRVSVGVSFPLCNFSLCSSTCQILPVWSVVRLHAQSHLIETELEMSGLELVVASMSNHGNSKSYTILINPNNKERLLVNTEVKLCITKAVTPSHHLIVIEMQSLEQEDQMCAGSGP